MKRDLKPCFGYSRLTHTRVGKRHRWANKWGVGCCVWCGRTLEELITSDAEEKLEARYSEGSTLVPRGLTCH